MALKNVQTTTLKIRQIEKNPILALSVNAKDIEAYGRLARAYGSVVPAIVGPSGEKGYRLLSGQARLEALAKRGIKEMPAIVADMPDEAEQMKLALMLSTMREGEGSLSEGAFIDILINRYGVSPNELAKLLKKSRSWISKRLSIAARLCGDVKELVKSGALCARSAEEISRLPASVQMDFAQSAVRKSLNKTDIATLVSAYNSEGATDALKKAIICSPEMMLDLHIAKPRAVKSTVKKSFAARMSGAMSLSIRLMTELKMLLAAADDSVIKEAAHGIKVLREAAVDLQTAIDEAIANVSPGKQEGGIDR